MTEHYVGTELELFAAARNWKRYVARCLGPFIAGRVLEVGAGIGSNIPLLWNRSVSHWTALEPDPAQAAQIQALVDQQRVPGPPHIVAGTLGALPASEQFDTILYIDVIEHIEDDAGELARAASHLNRGGHLVVLVPAHQFLFSPFDAEIGHHRRYNLRMLARLTPPGYVIHRAMMLDSLGLFASLANRILLRSAMPTPNQIAFWDDILVPISRLLDPLTLRRFGKTAVTVWTRF
jgi:SAM-dependent methyltransferase